MATKNVKYVHSLYGAGIWTQDLQIKSSPITTRPGLPHNGTTVGVRMLQTWLQCNIGYAIFLSNVYTNGTTVSVHLLQTWLQGNIGYDIFLSNVYTNGTTVGVQMLQSSLNATLVMLSFYQMFIPMAQHLMCHAKNIGSM